MGYGEGVGKGGGESVGGVRCACGVFGGKKGEGGCR